MRVLDLFCGAGGASRGYELAGATSITGIDIEPQPRYPYRFIRGDAVAFLDEYAYEIRGAYDLIHASPPCQAFTMAQRIQDRDHPDLIEPTRALLEKIGLHYVIENVPGSPLVNPIMLCGSMFPTLRTYRHRLFETSFPVDQPKHEKHTQRQAKMGRAPKPGEWIQVVGNFSGVEYAREAMGINWMSRNELREAIPPAYTCYVATHLVNTPAH